MLLQITFLFFKDLLGKKIAIRLIMQLNFLKLMIAHLTLFQRIDIKTCCKSAVIYLRNNTRNNHLVSEENINYGFCKNLYASKPIGKTICLILALFTAIYSFFSVNTFYDISLQNLVAFSSNILFFLFWKFGITDEMLNQASRRYAFTLISAIDTL